MRLTNRLTVLAELNPDYIKIGYEQTWAQDAQPALFNPITKLE